MIVGFIRHASTHWNAQGRMQGRRDIPLSVDGRNDAATWRLPGAIANEGRCLSSPLARAIETARLLGHRAPEVEPALTEMDWGAWEGFTHAELRARFGAEFTRNERLGLDFQPPGGESPRDVVARVARWLDSIVATPGPLVVVTHNGVLRALLALATGWDMTSKPPVRLAPASMHRFSVDRAARPAILECNVALRPAASATVPGSLPTPAPSATRP